jgi:hypothetical protein
MVDVTSSTTVVFDLGGVLIQWDPRHLYRKLFDAPEEMESFLAEVTTAEWNAQQDAGTALGRGPRDPGRRASGAARADRGVLPALAGDACR